MKHTYSKTHLKHFLNTWYGNVKYLNFKCYAIILILFFGIMDVAFSQLSITTLNTNHTINFDATVSNVNNSSFATTSGSNIFAASPAIGQMDADAWAIQYDGASETDAVSFPGSQNAGNNTSTSGGVGTAGVLAYNISSNRRFGLQPGNAAFTDGTLTLKITNNTGTTITSLSISYDAYAYNDQANSGVINFYHSSSNTNGSYSIVSSANFTSSDASTTSWETQNKIIGLNGLYIPNGSSYYIRWYFNAGGSGTTRDELALDNIVVSAGSSIRTVPYTHNFDNQDDWFTSGTTGIWELGDQTNGTYGPGTGHSGNSVYGTKLNAYYATNDVDAYLITPLIDLSGTNDPQLKFWMDMESESGNDGGTVQISVNGGAWITVSMADGGYSGNIPNDTDVDGLLNSEDGWSGNSPTGDWAEVGLDLFDLTTTGLNTISNTDDIQVRFWFGTNGSNNTFPGWYIDDFSIIDLAPCSVPGDQATSLVLTPDYTSVAGSFTTGSSNPDGYLIVRSTNGTLSAGDLPINGTTYAAGNTIGDGTVVQSGTGNTFNATGLTSSTIYYFFIFSQNYQSCSGGPVYLTTSPLTGSVMTLGCTVSTFPYTENFDGVTAPTLPNCWTIEDNNAPSDDWVTSTTNPNSSPNCMFISWDGTLPLDDWAFSPPLDLTGGSTYQVTFRYRASSSSYTERLEVDWGTSASSAGMSGTAIFDDNGFNHTTYQIVSSQFTPGSDGTYYIGWHAYSIANQLGILVDDIQIIELLPCAIPGDQPTALNLTPSYTTIAGTFTGATSNPDGYLVVASTNSSLSGNPADGVSYSAGDPVGGGTVVYSGPNTNFTANGLLSGTTYYFFIFSQNYECSGGPLYLTSLPLTGNAVTLNCTVSAYPYTENFDGVTPPALPTCWTIQNVGGVTPEWQTSTTYPNSSPNNLRITYNGTSALDDWAFTAPLQLTAGVTYEVTFQYRAYSSSYTERLAIDWGTSASAAGMSGSPIFVNSGFSNTTYTEGTCQFTAPSDGIYYLGFHAYSIANQYGIHIDDLQIIELLDCTTPTEQPTSLVLTPGYTTVNGSFTAPASNPDGYLVVASTASSLSGNPVDGTAYSAGDPLGGGTVVFSGPGTNFTANGLTMGTPYYFFVFSMNYACSNGPDYYTVSPLNGNTTTLTGTAVPYTHHFDTPGNWTVGGTADIWQLGDQTDNSFGPPSGHSGNSVYGTVLNANYDQANIAAYLYSPLFDMAGITAPRLSFWMDMESENGYDGGVLQISVNAGAWTTIAQADYIQNAPNDLTVTGLSGGLGWTGLQPAEEWQEVKLNLFNLPNTGVTVNNSSSVQFRYWFGSDGSAHTYPGWYIDDFSIFEPNDQTSQADAPTSGQIAGGTIASIANTSGAGVDVFRFDISDMGSGDGLSTFVNRIEISNGGGTADWTDHIAGAELWSGGVLVPDMNVTITDGDMSFTSNTGYFEVGDGLSRELTLRIWLTGSNNVDNSTLIFQIPTTGHGFTADVSGSEFNTTFPAPVTSNTFTVTVTATQLVFTGQPSTIATSGVPLTIQPIVSATDIHGNVDTDISTTVTLANTGGLTMANNTMAFVNGVANFGTAGNFQFTTGGKYVMLTATAGGLSSIAPSNEIAVDIVGCVLFDEDFETYTDRTDLPTPDGLWVYDEITNSANDWGIGSNGGDQFLSIYDGNTQQQYSINDDAETVAYFTTLIDAREFKNLSLDFNWFCEGAYTDYGSVVWSLNGSDWQLVTSTRYYSETSFQSVTGLDLSVCDGQQFYIGFRWINDGSGGTNPPFAVDDIVIRGYPKFDYNFTYREDVFSQITGTVVALDAQGGANISLPSGFSFQYDGTGVTAVRVNENGWMEMSINHTADPAATNDLQSLSNIPFLAPLWDNLSYDAQSRIIYAVDGTAPARVFTVEWKDILWGIQRQNFQVKLYETSNVIEFWYGIMNTNASGSASIGINNAGGCMNKLISIVPGTIPSASYTSEYNTINSAQYLTEGMVYVFNPLSMQNYLTWQEATVLVGQANWGATSTTVNQSTSAGANSSSVSSRGVLAVGSAYANRILLWNTIQTSNGNPADVVIGQSNFTSMVTGTTATNLDAPYNVCFTPDGQKLIVADSYNNRVLIWNTIPTDMSGAPYAADVVIGQTDFTTSSSGTTAKKLSFPTGVIVLPDGRLVVTDNGNNRVLIYNSVPTTNGVSADVVIGQSDFTTGTSGSTANKFDQPWDCAYTPDGKLLVSDDGAQSSGNHRILIFNTVPTTNGASANLVIGNTIFAAKASGSTRTEFDQPSVTCSVEGKIAIADFANSRVMMYERVPKINGAAADYVLGQPNFIDNPQYNDGYGNTGTPNQRNMYYPYSICFDLNGRLYVNGTQATGTGMNRVMIFGDIPTQTAELELSIVSDAVDVCIYNDVEYMVQVTNNGPDAATGVVVNAQLPIGFLPVDYSSSVGTYNHKSGYWMIPYIAVSETVTLTFSGEVQPGLAGTTITAYANIIASKQADSDYSNNGDNQVVAIRNFSAPVISLIDDQYINRNSHTIPVIGFTVSDDDGLADISAYTSTSSNTVLIPVNYTTNLIFGGTAPNMTLDIYPAIDQYGYSDMVLRVTDLHGCYNEEDFRVIVGNIWEGDALLLGTRWNEVENWSSNQVPTSTIEAIIPTSPIGGNFPIIDYSGAECEDLVIEPNAYVTVNDTRSLHIYGDLYIQSSSLGTGSFLDLNSASFNQIRIDGSKYIDRYVFNDAWHYLSSPLNGVSNKVLTESVCGAYNPNVIQYNEAYIGLDWMVGWEWPFYTPNTDPLVRGKGYGYYTFSGICTDNVRFTGGTLNTGNYSVLVSNQDDTFFPTAAGPHRGWNLIGNPYPSGLDANDFLTANSSVIDGTAYFWDEVGGTGFNAEGSDYAAWNITLGGTTGTGAGAVVPDKYISSGQAFFVHRSVTDVAGSNVNFTNSMREAENSYFYKKENRVENEVSKIKLSIENSLHMYNEIVVGMIEDATDGRDTKYDGYKIEGNPQLAFYSKIGNENFMFQGIPIVGEDEAKSVQLGMHAGVEGNYTIRPVLIEYIPESIGVYLEDTYLDKMIDLRKSASYSFSIESAGRYDDRFVLHFNMNHTPAVINPIEDRVIYAETYSEFEIPGNTFGDVDEGDELTYSASFQNGEILPEWIDFVKDGLKFRALPDINHIGDYMIRVSATDSRGASVSDDFKLSVIVASGISEAARSIKIYPNPTTGRFFIHVNTKDLYTYSVRDITGKKLIENKATGVTELDLSNVASGVYLISVTIGKETMNYKLMLK